jgi:hypothetical protein
LITSCVEIRARRYAYLLPFFKHYAYISKFYLANSGIGAYLTTIQTLIHANFPHFQSIDRFDNVKNTSDAEFHRYMQDTSVKKDQLSQAALAELTVFYQQLK